jgi:hypothetical protein
MSYGSGEPQPDEAVMVLQVSLDGVNTAYKAHKRGAKVICPVCGAEVLFALTKEDAVRYGKPLGVHCSIDKSHFLFKIF